MSGRRSWKKSDRSRVFAARFEVKSKDETNRTFEGDLSTSHLDLGDWDARDIVHPGAFKRWLDHFKAASDPYVPLLNSHDRWDFFSILGHLNDAEERLTGEKMTYELDGGRTLEVDEMRLHTEWQVIDGADGDKVLDRLRPGSGRQMSMGYEPIKLDYDTLEDGTSLRNLREVRVEEGSLVVFGMNPYAGVSAVKALLSSLGDGDLSADARAELEAVSADISRLLGGKAGDVPPDRLAADAVKALDERISALTLTRLDTRIEATRHSASSALRGT